ncbi:MAG: MFS transporter [Promethearchaeota archaeon]|nr:MAG: MFS transporter [Candidatus Lokiarchaeota archaeon]
MESSGFGKKQKLSFATGSFSQWFINGAFNVWVFTFYFTAVGLPVSYIMLAFVMWTVWNAINDPLIGYLSDRTHTRWGRRKPFIIIGTIPILIIEIILWIPPTDNHFLTFIYLFILLVCYDTFYTMVTLIDTCFPELYTTVEERAEVNTMKQVLTTLGIIMAFIVPGIFIEDLTEQSGYLLNGIVTSIIVGLTLLITIKWGIKERTEFKQDHIHGFSFIEGMKYTFKNKGYLLYVVMFFLHEYMILVLATTIPLYGKHILNISPFETSLLLAVLFFVAILSVAIWMKVDLKLGSRKGYALSMIAYFIATLPLLIFTTYLPVLITFIVAGVGFGGMLYFIWLIVADIIDDDELKTGVRREGTFIGISLFFMRLAMILSIVTISLVFVSTGWEEYAPNPDADLLLGLRLIVVVFPGLAIIASLICLYFYPYTKEKIAEMKEQMRELHTKKKERLAASK